MPSFWKDIDINFEKKNSGDIKDMTDEHAISNSLTNIFKTIQGTRRMLPDFALPIYNILFEQMDNMSANRLGELLWDAIDRWEPRVVVEGIEVLTDNDNNQYVINLNYYIGSASSEDSLQTFSSIIRAR